MVQANELRIGNYLTSLNGYLVRVVGISKEKVQVESNAFNNTLSAAFNYLAPVLLTPDILSQCGFVEIGTGANPQTRELETIYEQEGFYLSVKDDMATFIIG